MTIPSGGILPTPVLPFGNYETIGVAQASTNGTVVVAGSQFDARSFASLSYTIKVAAPGAGAVTWSVWGANSDDYTDEVAVLSPASVISGGSSTYSVAQAPYAYYRVKIIDTVGNTHGTATLAGIVKA